MLDLVPYWRPPQWAAAVIVVDALAWGGADIGLPDRWANLAGWDQMLLRALLFRLALHAQHPAATAPVGAASGWNAPPRCVERRLVRAGPEITPTT